MNYHLIIDDKFWPRKYDAWHELTEEAREALRIGELNWLHDKIKEWKDGITGLLVAAGERDLVSDELVGYIRIQEVIERESLALVAQEMRDQRAKHGYTEAHDDALNGAELESAALAVLSEDPAYWPPNMGREQFLRATEKDTVGRLTVAAALIASEIDRILRARTGTVVPEGPSLPPAGTVVEVRDHVHERLLRLGVDNSVGEHLSATQGLRYTILGSYADANGLVWVRLLDGVDMPLPCCIIKHENNDHE